MRRVQEIARRRLRKTAPLLLAVLQDAIAAYDDGRYEECFDIIDEIGRDAVAEATGKPAVFEVPIDNFMLFAAPATD